MASNILGYPNEQEFRKSVVFFNSALSAQNTPSFETRRRHAFGVLLLHSKSNSWHKFWHGNPLRR